MNTLLAETNSVTTAFELFKILNSELPYDNITPTSELIFDLINELYGSSRTARQKEPRNAVDSTSPTATELLPDCKAHLANVTGNKELLAALQGVIYLSHQTSKH